MSDLTLPEQKAAFRLGISPDLLMSYVRYTPKAALKHTQKLPYDSQRNSFKVADLDAWEAYLQEPWAAEGAPRPSVPKYIRQHLNIEAGGKCANCGTGHTLEVAHIVPYAVSRSHYHHNLILLCKRCHSNYDYYGSAVISREQIEALKQKLIAHTRSRISSPVPIASMPSPNHIFVGRDSTVAELRLALFEKSVVSVQGIGGIGKTQLVLQTSPVRQRCTGHLVRY